MSDDADVFAEWEEQRATSAQLLREALAAERDTDPPTALDAAGEALRAAVEAGDPRVAWLPEAAGLDDELTWATGEPLHPTDVLWELVAATIEPEQDPGLPAGEQATLLALVPSDWVGALLGVVRAGPGSPADARSLVAHLDVCPELEGPPLDPDDAELLAESFALRLPAWRAAGVVDDELRLTEVGAWILPRAACSAWGSDFDSYGDQEEWLDDDLDPDLLDDLEEEDELDEVVADEVATFEAWQRRAPAGSPDADADGEWLATMLQLRLRGLDEDPALWDRDDLAALFLEVAPRELVLPGEEVRAGIAAVRAYLRHLDDEGRLDDASEPVEELTGWLDHAGAAAVEAMDDRARWGPGKALLMAMRADGVDTSDPAAIRDWLEEFDARPREAREAVLRQVGAAAGLPTLVLPPDDELADSIRATALWRQVTGLVTYVGERLELTDAGNLRLADARRLVDELDTGDVFADADQRWPTRSSTELPALTRAFELALAVGLLECDGRSARPAYDRLTAIREDPEELWLDLVVAWLQAGMLASCLAGTEPPVWVDELDVSVLDLLIELVSDEGSLSLDKSAQVLAERLLLDEDPMFAPTAGDRAMAEVITNHVHVFAEALQLAGLVEVAGVVHRRIGESGLVVRSGGQVTATHLARLLLHRIGGADAHRLGRLTDVPADELIAALGALPAAVAEAEADLWLARRPATAATELADAVAGGGSERAVTGMVVLDRLGDAAEPALRRLAQDPLAGTYARAWLVQRGLVPAEPVGPEDVDGIVGLLAMLAARHGPDEVVEGLARLGGRDDQVAFLELAWRSSLDEVEQLLAIVGELHPDKAVRKASRKAEFKRRSAG